MLDLAGWPPLEGSLAILFAGVTCVVAHMWQMFFKNRGTKGDKAVLTLIKAAVYAVPQQCGTWVERGEPGVGNRHSIRRDVGGCVSDCVKRIQMHDRPCICKKLPSIVSLNVYCASK